MSELISLIKEIDESDWDAGNVELIQLELNKIILNFNNNPNRLQAEKAFLEIEKFVFTASKSAENGLAIPLEKEILAGFSNQDFEYIEKRFIETKNRFAQSEYGLVLFIAKKILYPSVELLLNCLYELCKTYYTKAIYEKKPDNYEICLLKSLENALYIAVSRKGDISLTAINRNLVQFCILIHGEWPQYDQSLALVVVEMTKLVVRYLEFFKPEFDSVQFLTRNREVAEHLEGINSSIIGELVDNSVNLSRKLGLPAENWFLFKAKFYEKIALSQEQPNWLNAISFLVKAMEIYKSIGDKSNLERVKIAYQKIRTSKHLELIQYELPEEPSKYINDNIRSLINEGDEERIIITLLLTPMIMPLEDIKTEAKSLFKQNSIFQLGSIYIKDDFGNTIDLVSTDLEKSNYAIFFYYGNQLKLNIQVLVTMAISAFKANKLSADGLINFFRKSWLGEGSTRQINGNKFQISYIQVIESGIRNLFHELMLWNENPEYQPNLVSATDSLILKAEYLLREICYKLGIPTFQPKGKPEIVMERTLADILSALNESLTPDDLFFIKFVLTEKMGFNLRHKIAHGLMDNTGYGITNAILAVIILLKISNYKFTSK